MKLTRTRLMLAMALGLAVGTAQADDDKRDGSGNISHVNGGITAEAGQQYGDLDTVNGGISVRRGAIARNVETVNDGARRASRRDDAVLLHRFVSGQAGFVDGGEFRKQF